MYIGNELTIFKDAKNWKNYWHKAVKSFIKGDVLEVGAGIGANTELFLQNSSDIKSLLAVEPDTALANQIKTGDARLSVHHGFLKDLDASMKFDTIIYIDVIEHIKKDAEELAHAKNYLKEGGHLIILVPALNLVLSEFDKAIGHFRRYNKKALSKSVPADLTQVKLFYLDSLGICASLMNKYLLRQSYPSRSQILMWDRIIIPLSKITDAITFRSAGKSLIGIWKR